MSTPALPALPTPGTAVINPADYGFTLSADGSPVGALSNAERSGYRSWQDRQRNNELKPGDSNTSGNFLSNYLRGVLIDYGVRGADSGELKFENGSYKSNPFTAAFRPSGWYDIGRGLGLVSDQDLLKERGRSESVTRQNSPAGERARLSGVQMTPGRSNTEISKEILRNENIAGIRSDAINAGEAAGLTRSEMNGLSTAEINSRTRELTSNTNLAEAAAAQRQQQNLAAESPLEVRRQAESDRNYDLGVLSENNRNNAAAAQLEAQLAQAQMQNQQATLDRESSDNRFNMQMRYQQRRDSQDALDKLFQALMLGGQAFI